MYRALSSIYKNVGTNPNSYIQRFKLLNLKIGSLFVKDANVLLHFNYKDILHSFDSNSTCKQCISCWETMGFVKNLGSKYLVLFDTDDYDLIFKSKFNLLFNSNNSLIDQYRDSIILKILAKEHHVDVIAKYKLSKKQNKNSNELTNQKIISHFGKYEEEICMDKKFVNLILEIWR